MDWSTANKEILERVVEEGESYLRGQLTLATSADQRAAALAAVFTAAATALIAGILALTTTSPPHLRDHFPIYIGGGIASLCFLIAAGFCIAAVFPTNFFLPGNQPENWHGDIEAKKAIEVSLAEETQHIQGKIEFNRACIARNATRFKRGAILGIAAPLAGLLFWAVTSSAVWVSMAG